MSDLPIAAPNTTDFDTAAWQAVLGPRQAGYYLPRFERLAQGQGGALWHWPAFVITWYWLIYRKLWGWALLYMLLPLLLLLPAGLLMASLGPKGSEGPVSLLYLGAVLLAPPLLANRAYFRHCRKLMTRQAARGLSREQYLAHLEAKGGTSHAGLAVVGLLVFVSVIGMLAAIAIPAYQDYVKRAQVQTVQADPTARQPARFPAQMSGQIPQPIDRG